MHGKDEFSKSKVSICIIPKEAGSICIILPKSALPSRLVIVELKRDLNYRGHVYI